MVGKKTDQVGIDTSGNFVSADGATLDKLKQAVNSCKDLVNDLVVSGTPPHVRAILPVLVVPTGVLWQVDYAADGQILKQPHNVDVATLFINHSWSPDSGPSYSLSHSEFVTLRGLPDAVKTWMGSTGFFRAFW
jgi:hypothetical protein